MSLAIPPPNIPIPLIKPSPCVSPDSKNQFAKGKNHINGIEGFWGLSKTRLARFKVISTHLFHLHLKECEFRYNYRNCDIFKIVLLLIQNRLKIK